MKSTGTQIADALIRLAKSIVLVNEGFESRTNVEGSYVLVTVRPANSQDMRALVGKRGAVVKSIKALAEIMGDHNGCKVNFVLAEPVEDVRPKVLKNQTGDFSNLLALVHDVIGLMIYDPGCHICRNMGEVNITVQIDSYYSDRWPSIKPPLTRVLNSIGYTMGEKIVISETIKP